MAWKANGPVFSNHLKSELFCPDFETVFMLFLVVLRFEIGSVENDPTGVDVDARRIAKNVDVDVDIAIHIAIYLIYLLYLLDPMVDVDIAL